MKKKLIRLLSFILVNAIVISNVDVYALANNKDVINQAGTVSVNDVNSEDTDVIDYTVPNNLTGPGANLRECAGTKNQAEWDGIYFGHYIQSDTNNDHIINEDDEAEPILWRVLELNDDHSEALLMSNYVMDIMPFNTKEGYISWDICTLRSWLNGYGSDENKPKEDYADNNFIDKAFSKEEQEDILVSHVETPDHYGNWYEGHSYGGNPTDDKIYVLSYEETLNDKFGFSDNYSIAYMQTGDIAKKLNFTPYAYQLYKEDYIMHHQYTPDNVYTKYWLRTSNYINTMAMVCNHNGYNDNYGEYVEKTEVGVVPVIRLKLDSDNWEYAGKIEYNGNLKEIDSVHVNLDANGGECSEDFKEIRKNWFYGTLPVPTKKGFLFTGWYTEKDGGQLIKHYLEPVSNTEHTLYAHWLIQDEEKLSNPYIREDGQVYYDTVYFGRYWQNDTNGDNKADKNDAKDMIKWRVLQVTDEQILLLSDRIIEAGKFNDTSDISWDTSSIREFLNGTNEGANSFITNAFNGKEKNSIIENAISETAKDKIFLLDSMQVINSEYGFVDNFSADVNKSANLSGYVKDNYGLNNNTWWMNGINFPNETIMYINDDSIYVMGTQPNVVNGIRPAIVINKLSDQWKYAGKILNGKSITEEKYQVVHFDCNGGVLKNADAEIIKKAGDKYDNLPVPEYIDSSKVFDGWYTEKEGGRIVLDNQTVLDSEHMTLYAHWKNKNISVSFDCNGGIVNTSNKTVILGQKYGDLPVPSKNFKNFAGWYTKPDGGEIVTADTIVNVWSDHKLYAHWNPIFITVTFDSCNGQEPYELKEYELGGKYSDFSIPKKEGYAFIGWFTKKEGGEQVLEDDLVIVNSDITLFAHYKEIKVNVTFDGNGGYVDSNMKSIASTGIYGDMPVAIRDKYVFAGWYTEKEGGKKILSTDKLISYSDHRLYAHYENINLVVKQKYNIKKYFKDIDNIAGYQYESADGAKVKINKKGDLICLKEGTVAILPYVKNGKNKQVLSDIEPLVITINKCSVDKKIKLSPDTTKVNMSDYYKSLPVNSNSFKYSCSSKKIAVIDPDTGELIFRKPGKVKVTLSVTNDQGKTVKITTSVILKKGK